MSGKGIAASPAATGLVRLAAIIGRFGTALVVLAFLAIASTAYTGGVATLDNGLRDLRFAAAPRLPTGNIVFVDIDSPSLKGVNVWPWPRHLHGDVLKALLNLGAEDVIFDVDFSVPSIDAEVAAFVSVLACVGGFVFLVAFA